MPAGLGGCELVCASKKPSGGLVPAVDDRTDQDRPSWMLRVRHHDHGPVWVLALSGESDLASRDLLAHELGDAEGRQRERLVLDLSRLRFCDAHSVELILGAAHRGWVGMAGASTSVRRVFELLDLDGALHDVPPPRKADSQP